MQDLVALDKFYRHEDPWGYKTNPEDAERKKIILSVLNEYGPFDKALDIGAGEGFITKDLPAKKIYGYEISNNASSRFPDNVERINVVDGYFDLITATGIFYRQYNIKEFIDIINKHASKIVLLCSIKSWERSIELLTGKQIFVTTFPYREYTEILRVYQYVLPSA